MPLAALRRRPSTDRPARLGLVISLAGLALTGVLSLGLIWDRLPFDSARWPGAEQRADERDREQARAEQSAMAWSRLLDETLICGGDMATLWASRPARDDDTSDGLAASAQALRPVAERCRSQSPSLRQVWLLRSPDRLAEAMPVWADAADANFGLAPDRLRARLLEAADTEVEGYAATPSDASSIDQIVPVRMRPSALLVLRVTPQPSGSAGDSPPRVLDERSLATGVAIPSTHGLRIAVTTDVAERQVLSLLAVALVLLSSAALVWSARRDRLHRTALKDEHRQSEKANLKLQREIDFRKDIEDASPVGLRVVDIKGRILAANRAFADAVGLTPKEVEDQVPPYNFWPAESLPEQGRRLDEILHGRASGEGYQVQLLGPGGSRWTASVKATALTDGRGWLLTSQDITASVDHRDKMERLQQDLQLQAATEWLGVHTLTLLHDVTTPARTIEQSAFNLERAARDVLTVPMKYELTVIRGQVSQQHALINLFKQQVKGELTYEYCDLAKIVDDAFVLQSHKAESINARLVNQVNTGLRHQKLARVNLLQVLTNLVGNALQWMGDTPILNRRVVIEDLVVIDPSSSEHPVGRQWLHLTVQDRGQGILRENWERIFESGVTFRPDGQGIGLWLCRWWIERMEGSIEVQSSSPNGTVMRVRLPFQPFKESPNAAHI